MKKVLFIWLLAITNLCSIKANKVHYTQSFIEEHYKYALISTTGTNIPISIVLAQCILESGWGKSGLATKGNNYFGITASKGNKRYNNTQYRVFQNKVQSFLYHSNLLSTNDNYKSLRNLDKEDYISWAKGLQKCGYAESKIYANTLIRIIEKYKLNKYDSMNKRTFKDVNIGDTVYALSYDKKYDVTIKSMSKNEYEQRIDFILFSDKRSISDMSYNAGKSFIYGILCVEYFLNEDERDRAYKVREERRKSESISTVYKYIDDLIDKKIFTEEELKLKIDNYLYEKHKSKRKK